MRQAHTVNLGLAVGALVALWHLGWAFCVALAWAQPIVNFALWAHFISPPVRVEPFSAGRAAILVLVTGAIGFAFGATADLIWHAIHRAEAAASPRRSDWRRFSLEKAEDRIQ